jgi:hypothetical protein
MELVPAAIYARSADGRLSGFILAEFKYHSLLDSRELRTPADKGYFQIGMTLENM